MRTHDRQLLTIGAVCAMGGIYFVLAGCGLAPPPGKINGPQWLAVCVGLVFLASGAMMPLPLWGWLAEYVGRAAFGFGAVLAWIITGAFAHYGAKKIFAKR